MTARLARRGPDRRSTRAGFTLLEMLAVILIIAILVSIAFPAYQAVISRTRVATVRSEMAAINSHISEFKSKFNTEPPSYIKFQTTAGGAPASAVALAPETKAILRKMFPGINLAAGSPIEASLTTAGLWGKELKGTEALVFFLGGVRRVAGASPTVDEKDFVGFSKNPANPFVQPAAGQSSRIGPFFEFKTDRLVDTEATPDGLLEYRDALPGQTLPFLYLSTAASGAYRKADAEGVIATWQPYRKTATGPYWNPNSYQLISPGSDADYGEGGAFDPNKASAVPAKDADNLTNFSDAALGG